MSETRRLTRLVGHLAAGMALFVAVLIPLGYGVVAYRYEASQLLADANARAGRISERLVDNMTLGAQIDRFTDIVRQDEDATDQPSVRVIDEAGAIVDEAAGEPPPPAIRRAALLFNGDTPVGLIEVEIGLRPLLLRILAAGVLGLMVATTILAVTWTMPRRIIRQAFARLASSERELRVARDCAEAGSRAKSEFLATMSHELRTPLNAIIGFAELMHRRLFGPLGHARYDEYADNILDSGSHLLAMVNDILDLVKAEAGQLEIADEIVDVGSVLNRAVRMVGPQAMAGALDVRCDFAEDCPRLRGDERRIAQIVINLLANAIKFTEPGGRIDLGFGAGDAGEPVLFVRDTGIGIAAADIPRALSVFQQIDGGHTRKHGGTGLGLPLTKRLIEAHDGIMMIESRLGEGTTITARFTADRAVRPAARASVVHHVEPIPANAV